MERFLTKIFRRQLVVTALTAAYLGVIWGFQYLPTCDGPSHVMNAVIIKKLLTGDGGVVHDYYALNLKPVPNLAHHALLVPLLFVFKPTAAEKVALTLLVVAFAGAWRSLAAQIAGRRGAAAEAFFLPLAFALPFQMGFFSFLWSLAAAAFALAFLYRHRDLSLWLQTVYLTAAGVGIYFCHLFGWASFVAGAAVIIVVRTAGDTLSRLKRLAALVPAAVPGLAYLAFTPHDEPAYWPARRILDHLAGGVFRSFNVYQFWLGYAAAAIFLGGAVWTLVARPRRPRGARWRAADLLLLGAVGTAALCFILPEAGPLGGGWLVRRAVLLPYLLLALWFCGTAPPRLEKTLRFVAPAFAALYLGATGWGYYTAQPDIREFVSGKCVVRPNARFVAYIYHFPKDKYNINAYMFHVSAYYAMESDAVDLTNYEAGNQYFPVKWRRGGVPARRKALSVGTPIMEVAGGFENVDYLLCWRINPFVQEIRDVFRDYELVHAKRHFMILKRKN